MLHDTSSDLAHTHPILLSYLWQVLVAYHKGFVRLALQNGRPLVPVFCFGEQNLFDNADMPKMQSWFRKRMGFAYAHISHAKRTCGRAFIAFTLSV